VDPKSLQLWLPMVVIAVVFALRFRNLSKPRPLRPARMWIAPLILLCVFGAMLTAMPPSLMGWGAIALGLLIGAAVGWKRGHLMHLEHDPATGGLTMRQSPAALLFILAVLVGRRILMAGLGADPAAMQDGHPDAMAMTLTDGLLGFAAGMVIALRVTLLSRARALTQSASN
jgi:uncharacterized membrane protein YccC